MIDYVDDKYKWIANKIIRRWELNKDNALKSSNSDNRIMYEDKASVLNDIMIDLFNIDLEG